MVVLALTALRLALVVEYEEDAPVVEEEEEEEEHGSLDAPAVEEEDALVVHEVFFSLQV